MTHAVVLDVDTGEDDALAILLACALRLPLRAIVTSYGNTTLANATANTAAILALAGQHHIPVIQGSMQPLRAHPHPDAALGAGEFVGRNGLCNIELPAAPDVQVDTDCTVSLARRLATQLGAVTHVDYIVTGPCTNLASVLLDDARSVLAIRQVYLMGGAITVPGNSGPPDATGKQLAEFNCYCDAPAVQVVLQSGIPLTMVPWDVTARVTIPYAQVCRLSSTHVVGQFVLQLMRAFLEQYGNAHQREFELNDPLTVLAWQGFGRYHVQRLTIDTEATTYGRVSLHQDGALVRVLLPFRPDEHADAVATILSALHIHDVIPRGSTTLCESETQ